MGLTIDGSRIGMAENSAGPVEKEENKKSKSNVFAGGLNLAEDPVAQKRKEAQQKAMKVVSDAWKSEKLVDDNVRARKENYMDMAARKEEATNSVADINMDKLALQEIYGVSDDSLEQQDLKLLEKRQDIQNKVSYSPLTEEELKRLAEIDEKPLTEYQTRALELNNMSANPRKDIEDLDANMAAETYAMNIIELERLKTHGMVDANKTAKAIVEAANKEIIGSLVNDAAEHIEEKLEESEEAAEEQAKAKEEREENLDQLKEKQAMEQAVIEGTKEAAEDAKAEGDKNRMPELELTDVLELVKSSSQSGDVQKSLDEIKNSMKLLEADLKGIEVDKQV